ncbi:MAG: N-acetyltransferase family protein [Candidatus Heimdallarchaeaceae archaeon]|jgi:GNAT superfamily N-acetyltransferase
MINQSDFLIKTYFHSEIPKILKKRLAILMKAQHMDYSDMPVHDLSYYLKPLNQPEDDEIGLIYILASEQSKGKTELVGYARLEYRKNSGYNQNYGDLQIYVRKDRRNRGCGKQLLNAIREEIPDFLTTINIHAEKDSISSKILEKILRVEKAFESRHYFSVIRELSIENVLELEREAIEKLERKGLEIIYTDSNTFHKYENEYAQLLEVIWNIGKNASEYESFPVERLRGRMRYFREEFNIFVHIFLVRKKSDNSLVAISENILYETNARVADESMIGVLDEYKDGHIEHALRLKSLSLLLQETEVTHWESSLLKLDEDQLLNLNDKILGFRIGKIFNRYKIPIKQFLNR